MIVHVVNTQAVLRLHAPPFRTSVCWLLHRSSLSAIPRDATISPAALVSARHFKVALIRINLAEAVTWESIEPLGAWLPEHGQ